MAIHLGMPNDGTFISSDGYSMKDSEGVSLNAMQASDKWKIVLNNVVYHINVKLPTKESE